MSRLPELERALTEAAEHQDALNGAGEQHRATADLDSTTSVGGRLRSRWRHLSRRGHVAGVLAGGLVLGAVATGSAQVAGLDPFGYLAGGGHTDRDLQPRGGPDSLVEFTSPPSSPIAWKVRVYVARNGHLCMNGGRARPGDPNPGYSLSCSDSDEVAQSLLDPKLAGRTLTTNTVIGGSQRHPKTTLVFGVVADGAPGFDVGTAPEAEGTPSTQATGQLKLPIDRTARGLSAEGAALVKTFPAELTLRVHAAVVDLSPEVTESGDLIVHEEPSADGERARLLAMDFVRWQKTHSAKGPAREQLTDRLPDPVSGATSLMKRLVPAFARRKTGVDPLPKRLVDRELRRYAAQPGGARRLRVSGEGAGLGTVWAVPGGMAVDGVPRDRFDGVLCLAGALPQRGCHPLTKARPMLPALEAVTCARGLPHDRFLVWAFVPAGATRATVRYAGGATRTFRARDLLVLLRPKSAPRVTAVEWTGPKLERRERTKYPSNSATARCAGPNGPEKTFIDLRQSATSSGLSMWSAN
ncbi:MAG: hypothetical protein Q7T55_21110 [Solirubrobacteraceae bacterium]|nr:hypothetical protein [Solirubrobacteraceae bacterium]